MRPLPTVLHSEKLFRLALVPCFVVLFGLTCYGSYWSYLVNHNFNMGDWYINYQGGFVRRGFIGEVLFQLAQLTGLTPGHWVMVAHLVFYGLYMGASCRLLMCSSHLLAYSFLVISPVVFTFQLHGVEGGYRKEIMGLAFLALAVVCSQRDDATFKKYFGALMLLYPLAILSHELLAVFVPLLLALYFIRQVSKPIDWLYLCGITTPSVLAFLASCIYMGNEQQIAAIYASLGEHAPQKGAIYGLIADTGESFQRTWHKILHKDQKNHYFIGLALASLGFIPLRARVTYLFKRPWICLCLLGSYAMTFPLFLVGTDWGRFIYLQVSALFLLSLAVPAEVGNRLPAWLETWKQGKITSWLFAALLLLLLYLYGSQWELRHCCL